MRNPGLFAFVLTTGVLVPAAAHYLTAGHDQVVKFAAPSHAELELDGATIEARLAHPLVDPGEGLKIKLSASGAKGKQLAVGVLVYGSAGDEGARVPSPPVGVAYKTITIPITNGDGETEISIPLKGAEGNRYYPQPFNSYEVLVMAPKAAAKLNRLHAGAALIDTGEIPDYNASAQKFMGLYQGWGRDELKGDDAKLFGEGAIARLDAHTRAINKSITLDTPATTQVGLAFTVGVTVKNPSKKKATNLELSLETPPGVVDNAEDAQGISALIMQESRTFDLAPGETKRFEFRVMPDEIGVLGLYAAVRCQGEDGEYGDDCKAVDGLTRMGTFDATEIVKPEIVDEPAPSIVGKK